MTDETDKRKEVYEWRECVEKKCPRKRFYISVAEKEYFDSKTTEEGRPFALPRRCYPCRIKRRAKGSNHGNKA